MVQWLRQGGGVGWGAGSITGWGAKILLAPRQKEKYLFIFLKDLWSVMQCNINKYMC